MKKFIISLFVFSLFFTISSQAFSRPIYFGFRIGIFAKWQITVGDCEDGFGACLSYPLPNNDNAQIGYDTDQKSFIYVRVAKSNEISQHFSKGKFVLQEDSPIDPKLSELLKTIENPKKKIVYLNKGTYLVNDEGEYYVVAFTYYLK